MVLDAFGSSFRNYFIQLSNNISKKNNVARDSSLLTEEVPIRTEENAAEQEMKTFEIDINKVDPNTGLTRLNRALFRNDLEAITDFATRQNARINEPSLKVSMIDEKGTMTDDWLPPCFIGITEFIEGLKILIQIQSFDINVQTPIHMAFPLFFALKEKKLNAANLLLDESSKKKLAINLQTKFGFTALYEAVWMHSYGQLNKETKEEYVKIVKRILDLSKVDIFLPTVRNLSPLMVANKQEDGVMKSILQEHIENHYLVTLSESIEEKEIPTSELENIDGLEFLKEWVKKSPEIRSIKIHIPPSINVTEQKVCLVYRAGNRIFITLYDYIPLKEHCFNYCTSPLDPTKLLSTSFGFSKNDFELKHYVMTNSAIFSLSNLLHPS